MEFTETERYKAGFEEFAINEPYFIDWCYWLKLPKLTAAEATKLLCCLEPDRFKSLELNPGKHDTSDSRECAGKMHRMAHGEGRSDDTAAGWLTWAKAHDFNVSMAYEIAIADAEAAKIGRPAQVAQPAPAEQTQPPELAQAIPAAAPAQQSVMVQVVLVTAPAFTPAPEPSPAREEAVVEQTPAPTASEAQEELVQAAPVDQIPPTRTAQADAPDPLTTSDIAYCFAGLHWDEQRWKKPLGDKPKWLQPCIAIPGRRGVSETRWNPVLIGAELVAAGHAKPNSVRARFQSKPRLSAWLEAWKTYEADYLDTE